MPVPVPGNRRSGTIRQWNGHPLGITTGPKKGFFEAAAAAPLQLLVHFSLILQILEPLGGRGLANAVLVHTPPLGKLDDRPKRFVVLPFPRRPALQPDHEAKRACGKRDAYIYISI